MAHLRYLTEEGIENLSEQSLLQVLSCCYDQNECGIQLVENYSRSKSKDFQRMSDYIINDRKDNLIAIAIIKNYLDLY